MKSSVIWNDNLTFTCTNERGDSIVLDGDKKTNSPMEAVLAAAGACSSVDVVEILKKGRFNLTECRCELTATRADSPPQVFTQIDAHYYVSGSDLTEKAVSRAVALSVEKYCSVMKMLDSKVNIVTQYSITHAAN